MSIRRAGRPWFIEATVIAAPVALFRCDASPAIGAGHVTRCMALAEELVEAGWHVVFATGSETLATVPALAAAGLEIKVLGTEDPIRWARHGVNAVDLLVVDHYGLDAAFERACRAWARRILVLDDATGRDHDCDVLVDSAAADASVYAGHLPASAQALTGPTYALVRRCFLTQRDAALARRDGRPVSNILLTFGATDPRNATSIVLDVLDEIVTEVSTVIAMSSRAPHREDVQRRLRGRTRLIFDPNNLPELMVQADLAIGAAGASAFERAVLGLPAVLLLLADNQRGLANLLICAGAAEDGGSIENGVSGRHRMALARLIADRDARIAMAQAASRLVDGRGGQRIARSLTSGNS